MTSRDVPHCGSDAVRIVTNGYTEPRTRDVECTRCGATSPLSVWNKRCPTFRNQPNPEILLDMLPDDMEQT